MRSPEPPYPRHVPPAQGNPGPVRYPPPADRAGPETQEHDMIAFEHEQPAARDGRKSLRAARDILTIAAGVAIGLQAAWWADDLVLMELRMRAAGFAEVVD